MLSDLYASVAARRRRWYDAHPEARRRLSRPVVSVGALAAGGSGKTPVAAHVAELLRDSGERPSVLSRGYRRTDRVDGVVVVRDAAAVRATLATAGDEPLMLAHRLDGVRVLVSEDRFLAGRLAETQLDASVHVLDDGFQHLPLMRDLDLLVTSAADTEQHTLPGGRLRESQATAAVADALVVDAATVQEVEALGRHFGVAPAFRLDRRLDPPRPVENDGDAGRQVAAGARVLALAGIAAPRRFAAGLRASGYDVADVVEMVDHHPYSRKDIARIAEQAATLGVDWVLTTEKDLVRLRSHAPFPFPLASVPLVVTIEPADRFHAWLLERVRAVGARP